MEGVFKSLDELKEHLHEMGHDETIVFDNPSYVTAAIGLSQDGRVVYDYEAMIEYLMETDEMEYEDAMEFIDYNTIRAIPYFGEMAPVVLYPFEQ